MCTCTLPALCLASHHLAPPSHHPPTSARQVRRLQHGTEYTCWFALQKKALRRSKGSLGHVQLRFSVHWSKPRRHLLQYLSPPATVELALISSLQHTAEQARGLIEFTRFGQRPDTRYQWSTLDGHIKEMLRMLEAVPRCIDTLEEVLHIHCR